MQTLHFRNVQVWHAKGSFALKASNFSLRGFAVLYLWSPTNVAQARLGSPSGLDVALVTGKVYIVIKQGSTGAMKPLLCTGFSKPPFQASPGSAPWWTQRRQRFVRIFNHRTEQALGWPLLGDSGKSVLRTPTVTSVVWRCRAARRRSRGTPGPLSLDSSGNAPPKCDSLEHFSTLPRVSRGTQMSPIENN